MNDEMIICRCEEVTKDEIAEAIRDGRHTISGVKRHTRAGMGACQGRTCSPLIAAMLRAEGTEASERSCLDTPRTPLVPVMIRQLQEGGDE